MPGKTGRPDLGRHKDRTGAADKIARPGAVQLDRHIVYHVATIVARLRGDLAHHARERVLGQLCTERHFVL